MTATERTFPILVRAGDPGATVPWDFVAPHAVQARRNHNQTLERLAERGGLEWSELVAVIQGKDWTPMKPGEGRAAIEQAVARWRAERAAAAATTLPPQEPGL